MVHEFTIHFKIGSRESLAFLATALLAALPIELGSETITLSTTYPSPVGIYARIITTGGGTCNGGPCHTLLTRDNVNANVGIGTASPTNKLQVSGTTLLNGDVTIPSPARLYPGCYWKAFSTGTMTCNDTANERAIGVNYYPDPYFIVGSMATTFAKIPYTGRIFCCRIHE